MVGEAADGAEAVAARAPSCAPDVVLMDIRMPGWTASRRPAAILRRARRRDARVLVLTTFDLDEYVFDALRAGASGFLLKDTPAGRAARRHPRGGRRRGAARAAASPGA